jgi:hypothetical protein
VKNTHPFLSLRHSIRAGSKYPLRNPEGNKSANIAPDSGSVFVRQPAVHIEIFAAGCRAEIESEDKQDCGFISFLVPKVTLVSNKIVVNEKYTAPPAGGVDTVQFREDLAGRFHTGPMTERPDIGLPNAGRRSRIL